MSWFVTYGNRGLVDLKLPLLKFSAPGASEILLYESTLNWADSFSFWGLNPEALLPTLGPGQEVTFEVRVKMFTATPMTVALMTGEDFAANATPFNWSALPPAPGADPTKWAAMVSGLNDRLGETVGEYHARLERELAELAAGELRYSYLANINGRWLLGDEFEGESVKLPIIEVPEGTPLLSRTPGLHGPNVKLPPDGIRKTWVLLLTDTDYCGIGASHLRGVARDFEDVKNYMRNELRVPEEQFYGQHDTTNDVFTWTHDRFIEALKTFKGRVDGDDNLVVWFAGHGGRNPSGTPYLCLNDGYVSPAAFQNAINEVGAGTTYFVNDSCHSGAFVDMVNPDNTTFVGIAGTMGGRVSWENASGGELTTKLKAQLRRCRSLQTPFDMAQAIILTSTSRGIWRNTARVRCSSTSPGRVSRANRGMTPRALNNGSTTNCPTWPSPESSPAAPSASSAAWTRTTSTPWPAPARSTGSTPTRFCRSRCCSRTNPRRRRPPRKSSSPTSSAPTSIGPRLNSRPWPSTTRA